jgi:hypothetical protein
LPLEARRLALEFFLPEVKAEYRKITRRLDDVELIALRPKILSASWALVKNWAQARAQAGSIIHESFPQWSRIIGASFEHNGFLSPLASGQVGSHDRRPRPPSAAGLRIPGS